MKIKGLGIALLATVFAAPAFGDTIGLIDVGDPDTVLDSDDSNLADFSGPGDVCDGFSGAALEECWAESVVGGDLTLGGTTENVTWQWTDGGNIAFELASSPGHYIVKNATVRLIVENVAMYDWGVLDGSLVEFLGLGDDFTISHVSDFGGVSVPEPGTLLLLGAGLVGLGMRRRKKVA